MLGFCKDNEFVVDTAMIASKPWMKWFYLSMARNAARGVDKRPAGLSPHNANNGLPFWRVGEFWCGNLSAKCKKAHPRPRAV